MTQILLLPEDDDVLILRREVRDYGLPARATLARWASRPADAPCELPYTLVGREVAYRVGNLRKLQAALTFRHSADRAAKSAARENMKAEAKAEAAHAPA